VTTTNDDRKAFESYALNRGFRVGKMGGDYLSNQVGNMWLTWQQARLSTPSPRSVEGEAVAVAVIRHFNYSGIVRNGFSQEPVMIDGAPILTDGTKLYTQPAPAAADGEVVARKIDYIPGFVNAPDWYKSLTETHMEICDSRVISGSFSVSDKTACRWANSINCALALSQDLLTHPATANSAEGKVQYINDNTVRSVADDYFRLCHEAGRKPMADAIWNEQLQGAIEAMLNATASTSRGS
jgi:hypothetical protein